MVMVQCLDKPGNNRHFHVDVMESCVFAVQNSRNLVGYPHNVQKRYDKVGGRGIAVVMSSKFTESDAISKDFFAGNGFLSTPCDRIGFFTTFVGKSTSPSMSSISAQIPVALIASRRFCTRLPFFLELDLLPNEVPVRKGPVQDYNMIKQSRHRSSKSPSEMFRSSYKLVRKV